MKKRLCILALIATILANVSPVLADDGFYVVSGGGRAGKVLKTEVFHSFGASNTTLGTSVWEKLDFPQWTYNKLSATSYLVITYQDSIQCSGTYSVYQLRVNDLVSAAGANAAILLVWGYPNTNRIVSGATGVWWGVPKGDVDLSVWHRQEGCSECIQNAGGSGITNVVVMEIES